MGLPNAGGPAGLWKTVSPTTKGTGIGGTGTKSGETPRGPDVIPYVRCEQSIFMSFPAEDSDQADRACNLY